MRDFIRHILTGEDNESHDVGRVLAVLSVLVGLGLQIFVVVWRNQPFDLTSFGGGTAALFAGIGALLWMKKDTEPKP
jgi:preprotein translocase subunit SecG